MRKVFEDMGEVEYKELEPPPEGWHEITCTFESHSWTLEIEEGKAHVVCIDPCDLDKFNPSGPEPSCSDWWSPEDLFMPKAIPIKVTYVDDSTPSGPWGPAEYGYWLEIKPHSRQR